MGARKEPKPASPRPSSQGMSGPGRWNPDSGSRPETQPTPTPHRPNPTSS